MPRTESQWDRRMRENRTSGGRRSEATVHAWYTAIEAHQGKPGHGTRPQPKHEQFLAYSTSDDSPWNSEMPKLFLSRP